jgi:hypothetical protein
MSSLKTRVLLLAIAYVFALMFFVSINPEKLSLLFILLPFLIIFGLLYATVSFVLNVFFDITKVQKKIYSLVLSIMPTLLFIIQSITQLTIRDVLLSLSITVIIIWYTSKSKQST